MIDKINVNGTLHDINDGRVNSSAVAGQVLTSGGSGNAPAWKTGELIHYVTNVSGTAGSTATNSYNRTRWVGTCDGVTSLYTGLMVTIKVPVAGVNKGVSLNINSLGEHPVMYNNSILSTQYPVNTMVPLTYDADATISIYVDNVNTSFTGCWRCDADYDSIVLHQLKHGSSTVTSTTNLGRYVLLLQKDENKFVPVTAVNNSTATNKQLTTDSFNPFGDILYYSYTTVINANASPSAGYLYQQIALDLRYSFNTGTTLTSNKDVYIVATPQADGSAKLYSTPIAQELPSTEDGLIYIRLGHAYSTYNIELFPTHPVYLYKNGKIQVYTGLTDTDTNTTYKFTIGSTTKGDSTNGVDLGTLKSETAASNGTTLSLVTTGEKATWNAKTSNVGTVTGVTVGTGGTNYTPTNGVVTIPAYPTTLPASDVSSWAKAANKPSYAYSEIGYTVNPVSNSSTTLSLNGTTPIHVVTTTAAITSLTLSQNPSEGHSCHVILTASTDKSVTIPANLTNVVYPDGEGPIDLEIPAGGYVEVDFIMSNNKVYVRAIQ